jgi:outer membrane cobalamin receptor
MPSSRPSLGYSSLVVCLLVAVLALATGAAAEAGTIRGQVTDPAERPVPAARVVVAGPLGTRSVLTDAEGRFEVPDLPAARYRVLVEVPGFSAEPRVLTLGADDVVELPLALIVAALAESVVVSAAQIPMALSDAPATMSVIDASDLRERQVDTLAGALRTVPGFGVARNGGFGAVTSLFPRGGESDYTLVLVDGLRVNTFGGGFDASQLALGDVERIEVVRGPQSAVFGSDAIGGVVQIITRHGGPVRGDALGEWGSFGTWRAAAGTAGTRGRLTWSGSAERHASDGFTGTAPVRGERVRNDDGWLEQVGGSAAWHWSPDTHVRATARRFRSERGYPGPFGSDPIGAFPGIDIVSRGENAHVQAGVAATHAWTGRVRQQVSVTVSDLDSAFASAFGPSAFETRRVTGRTQADILIGTAASVSLGLEATAERAQSTYITGGAFQQVPIERGVIGPYAELRQQVGARLAVTAGVRADRVHRAALEGDPSAFAPRPAFEADSRTAINPRVAAVWTAWRDGAGAARTRLHASAGTGIRPPDAYEIAFTDNPGLRPERSRSVEGGVSHSLARGSVELQATVFANTYDDLIVTIGRSLRDASRYRSDNVSNARARGLETAAAWRTRGGLSARATYTWLATGILAVDRTTLAPPPFTPGDPLLRRPRHSGSLDVRVTRSRAVGFVELGARGRTLDVEPNYGAFGGLFPARGYAVVNAGATVRVARQVELFARAMNLADQPYEETLGFPAPRRNGTVGVRVALGR